MSKKIWFWFLEDTMLSRLVSGKPHQRQRVWNMVQKVAPDSGLASRMIKTCLYMAYFYHKGHSKAMLSRILIHFLSINHSPPLNEFLLKSVLGYALSDKAHPNL